LRRHPIEPMYFIQTPKQVWMIWQRDHMVRRIYITNLRLETVCAENNGDHFNKNLFPIPEAETPDF